MTDIQLDPGVIISAREHPLDAQHPARECLEEALAEKVAAAKRENWVRENSAAIAAYNDFVEENGLAADGLRSF